MTLQTLTTTVQTKAYTYITESGETMATFPSSIVDFVVEYAINESHFPSDFTEEQIATRLSKCVNALAMACIEVYSRVGAEGEKQHNENGVNRVYDGTWISSRLHDVLPNYVRVL
jgi:hypothetical protein